MDSKQWASSLHFTVEAGVNQEELVSMLIDHWAYIIESWRDHLFVAGNQLRVRDGSEGNLGQLL